MSISSVGSNSAQIQQAANNLFAKLDTKKQGYVDASELQTAFSEIAGDGQGTSSDATDFMSAVDTNGDGQISQQELTAGFQKVADQLDAQFSASRVSSAQSASQPPSVDDIFSSLDTKNQGYIDKSELQTAFDQNSSDTTANSQKVDQIFKALDTNGDGKISKDELSTGMEKLASQSGTGATQTAAAPQAAGHAHHAHGAGGGKSDSSNSSSQVFDPADTNQDGTVSLAELLAYQGKTGQASTDSSQSGTQNSSQNSMEAVMKVMNQLAQTYGQAAIAATSQTNAISELA